MQDINEPEPIKYVPSRTLKLLESAEPKVRFEDVHRVRKARLKRTKARVKRKARRKQIKLSRSR